MHELRFVRKKPDPTDPSWILPRSETITASAWHASRIHKLDHSLALFRINTDN